MRQATRVLEVRTSGPGLTDITRAVSAWVEAARGDAAEGLLTLLCRHTSASLTLQENADPDVGADLARAFEGLAPRGGAERYAHHAEGPDDMPAHIRTVLSGVHLSVPLIAGRLALGTWQGIWLWEHRDRPHQREVACHLICG